MKKLIVLLISVSMLLSLFTFVNADTEEPDDTEILFEADFSSMDAFLKDWELQGDPSSYEFNDGKFCVVAPEPLQRAYIKYQDWSKYNPETKEGTGGYANYAIKAVIHGTEPTMTNLAGIIFRATEIDPDGDNSFDAMYAGFGNTFVRTYKYKHNWAMIETFPLEYQQNVDYTLEVLVYNDQFIFLFNNEQVTMGSTEGYDFGTVGLKTWKGLYECTEFSVRTLGSKDYEKFGVVSPDTPDNPDTPDVPDTPDDPTIKPTGGASIVFAAVAVISLAGLAIVSSKRRTSK